MHEQVSPSLSHTVPCLWGSDLGHDSDPRVGGQNVGAVRGEGL